MFLVFVLNIAIWSHPLPLRPKSSQVAFFLPVWLAQKKGPLLLPHGTDDPGSLGISQVGPDFPGEIGWGMDRENG